VKICDFGLARSVEGIDGAHLTQESEEQLQQQALEEQAKKKEAEANKKGGKLQKQ
jgi:hypothetical protein